jgi:hypothetical protein
MLGSNGSTMRFLDQSCWPAVLRSKSTRLALLVSTIAALLPPAQPEAAVAPRIAGSTPPPVASDRALRVGHLDPGQMIGLTITLKPRRQAELGALLRDIRDPDSPRFHRFLTFNKWRATYAPTAADVDAVATWARDRGLKVMHRFRSNLAIKVAAKVGTVERALDLRLNRYAFHGKRFFSNDRNPAIEPSLRGIVKHVVGLNGLERFAPAGGGAAEPAAEPVFRPGPFRVDTPALRGRGHGRFTRAATRSDRAAAPPNLCCRNNALIEPPDLYSSEAYDWDALQKLGHCCNPTNAPGGTPREQSIAIIGAHAVSYADLLTFFTDYGLAYNVNQVQYDDPPCCGSKASGEMTLDIEYSVAMSNSFSGGNNTAHVWAYEGGNNDSSGLLDAWEGALSDDQARTASTSFGAYETLWGNRDDFHDVTDAMSAIGWSIVAASGDHGAYDDCTNLSVQYPAVDPNVAAVGGTTLSFSSSKPLKFGSEVAWNGNGCGGQPWPGSNNGGGGGGCSTVFDIPWWQSRGVTGCGDKRAVPDIALNSGAGQTMYWSGNGTGWQGVGGTSIAAPEFAGFLAQANAYARSLGPICGSNHDSYCSPLGNVNPAIWLQGLGSFGNKNPFYDITNGCNGGLMGATGFCAVSGYDKATGWGSANMLAFAWLLNQYGVSGNSRPTVDFQASSPAPNRWYNTDQTVFFIAHSPAISGTDRSPGIAGFTARWDSDPGSPYGHATPGSGDPFYSGPEVRSSTGALHLKDAGPGCHIAYVRAWDNLGEGTLGKYGPVCYDTDPPTVSCSSPDADDWSAVDLVVTCQGADALSGLANVDDDLFFLSTNVLTGTETANAFTNSRLVLDNAGNATPAGPFGPFRIDKKPPSITISSPTASSTYLFRQQVAANYDCQDAGSGVASCTGPVPSGAPFDTASVGTKAFTVAAKDAVGNPSSASVTYAVTYRICLLYDPTRPSGSRGYLIQLQLCDANGTNVSASSIKVTATAVDGDPNKARPLGTLNSGNAFLYGPGTAPGASYMYLLDTLGLSSGSHVLNFTVQGDPITHAAPFVLK